MTTQLQDSAEGYMSLHVHILDIFVYIRAFQHSIIVWLDVGECVCVCVCVMPKKYEVRINNLWISAKPAD